MGKSFFATLKALFASSRPLQSTLSIAQPLFGAFLATGGIPGLGLLALLAVGSAAGLYAVFAMNDLLDYELDLRTVKAREKRGWDIDSVFARHPLTAGLVNVKQQVAWITAMAFVAVLILYFLNPVALALFALAVVLEAVYCKLALVSKHKFVLAGAVVAVGVFIGWFAAGGRDNFPVLVPLGVLFFAWEVGGRNIPNDFSDISQDRVLGVKTLASAHGAQASAKLIAAFAAIALAANAALAYYAGLGWFYLLASTAAGIFLLLSPALKLLKRHLPADALEYFNHASLYPAAIFAVLALAYALRLP